MAKASFFNRDLSWISFNRRVLEEAANASVPLLERLKFLGIFSSNLDEFYRVRMPAIMALEQVVKEDGFGSVFRKMNKLIYEQQVRFGQILEEQIIPQLEQEGIIFINNGKIPEGLLESVSRIFFNDVAGFLHPVTLSADQIFFPESNHLYLVTFFKEKQKSESIGIIKIPVGNIPRFFSIDYSEKKYIVFLEDVISLHLSGIYQGRKILASSNIKVTRDADLKLEDNFDQDIARKIEKQLQKRDQGRATRLLFQPGISAKEITLLLKCFNLPKGSALPGGNHHAYKDLFSFPLSGEKFRYPPMPPITIHVSNETLFGQIIAGDMMVHTPYHDYNIVLRFFNEAALDTRVREIYTTLYRIAEDSRIAHALINAARNGKQVTVLVELKARFDEANNLRWSKRMKEAGVKIVYSSQQIKVHAKIALIIRNDLVNPYIGLLATGNLNEQTAKVYTDHVLLTAHKSMLRELHTLFSFLIKKQKPEAEDHIRFNHLLVAQFNLQQRFLKLIDREIQHARAGKPAYIKIKLNNLEEEKLIKKLYKASAAGVKVDLLVRGICCLKPGIKDLSENITARRIVDRFLEHGRIFVFHNDGDTEVFAGSSDWMIRNIYRRIEVCFPVYDKYIKQQLQDMLDLQFRDNVQAVWHNETGLPEYVSIKGKKVRSQQAIYDLLVRLNKAAE